MANANLTFPGYDDWVSGGTYQVNIKTKKHSRQDGTEGHTGVNTRLDPNDKNMQGYYDNYKNAVTNAINAGKTALAKAIVTSHGHTWQVPSSTATTTTATPDTTTATTAIITCCGSSLITAI